MVLHDNRTKREITGHWAHEALCLCWTGAGHWPVLKQHWKPCELIGQAEHWPRLKQPMSVKNTEVVKLAEHWREMVEGVGCGRP